MGDRLRIFVGQVVRAVVVAKAQPAGDPFADGAETFAERRFSFRRPLFRLSSEPTSHSNSEPSIASRPQNRVPIRVRKPINRRQSLDSHRFRQPKFLQHLMQLRRKTLSRVSIDGH